MREERIRVAKVVAASLGSTEKTLDSRAKAKPRTRHVVKRITSVKPANPPEPKMKAPEWGKHMQPKRRAVANTLVGVRQPIGMRPVTLQLLAMYLRDRMGG